VSTTCVDYDPEDDEPEPPPEFDPKLAGPEYWLYFQTLKVEQLLEGD
jgi:hypothetical protein